MNRDERIVQLVTEHGAKPGDVARIFNLSERRVRQIVVDATGEPLKKIPTKDRQKNKIKELCQDIMESVEEL